VDQFEVSVTADDGVAVVSTRGELDLLTLEPFVDAINLAATTARVVVVDLAEVTFIDSSGLSALIASRDHTGIDRLTLRNPSDIVRRLLALADVEDLFGLADSDE
jgi:anti-anti-sigma factor